MCIFYTVQCEKVGVVWRLRWRRKDDESDRGDDHIHSFLAPLLCLCAFSVGRRGHRVYDGSTRHLSDQHAHTNSFPHCVSCMCGLSVFDERLIVHGPWWWLAFIFTPSLMFTERFYMLPSYLAGLSCTIMLRISFLSYHILVVNPHMNCNLSCCFLHFRRSHDLMILEGRHLIRNRPCSTDALSTKVHTFM